MRRDIPVLVPVRRGFDINDLNAAAAVISVLFCWLHRRSACCPSQTSFSSICTVRVKSFSPIVRIAIRMKVS
jgi:hypothetical protein